MIESNGSSEDDRSESSSPGQNVNNSKWKTLSTITQAGLFLNKKSPNMALSLQENCTDGPTSVYLCSFKDLGNAIREGNLEFIRKITKNDESSRSFCHMISQRAIHFDISLRMKSSQKYESKHGYHRLFSQKPEIKGIHPLLRYSEKIHVTPFHLAILAQEKDVISLMLNSTLKYSENFRYSNHFQGK